MDQVDSAFTGSIDLPNNSRTRSEHLLAVQTALGSEVDISIELGLAHPDPVVRTFLEASKTLTGAGKAIFVMNADGEIFTSVKQEAVKYHHSNRVFQ